MRNHQAKKHFGQNFLVDERIIHDIIAGIGPEPGDHIVEIGPGLGALTRPLLRRLNHLDVVEIDRDIIARLQSSYAQEIANSKLTIHAGDALKFDFSKLAGPLRVVGNLPYNVSTPLLFHFAEYAPCIKDMHLMLQKEVVERMTAGPSTPEYGRLSVMLQYRFRMEKLLDVPPESFRPVPKVNSAVIRVVPLPISEVTVQSENWYAQLVRIGFAKRRKTLRNALKEYLSEQDFQALGIDAWQRAEDLGVAEFAKLANYCGARQGAG